MKLFKIELDNVYYDDYDSCIIVAESKEQVEELCKCNFVKYEEWDMNKMRPIILYEIQKSYKTMQTYIKFDNLL